MKVKKQTILLIDDEPLVLEMFAYVLRQTGFRVKTALSANEGLEYLECFKFDGLLTDIELENMRGFEIAEHARSENPELPVMLITGDPNSADEIRAASSGFAYLKKPIELGELVKTVHSHTNEEQELPSTQRNWLELDVFERRRVAAA